MNKLYDLYHIIPAEDNCSFVYRDAQGSYKTKSKSKCNESIKGDKLIFLTEHEAVDYIKRYLNPSEYRVGSFAGNVDLYNEARRNTSVSFVDGHSEA